MKGRFLNNKYRFFSYVIYSELTIAKIPTKTSDTTFLFCLIYHSSKRKFSTNRLNDGFCLNMCITGADTVVERWCNTGTVGHTVKGSTSSCSTSALSLYQGLSSIPTNIYSITGGINNSTNAA